MKALHREEAIKLRQQGISVRDIATRLGVAKSSVSLWTRHIELTQEQREHLKQNQVNHIAKAQTNPGSQWNREIAKAQTNPGSQWNRETYLKLREAYQNEGRLAAREGRLLHMSGCLLYWAEGAKRRNSLIFVNSDPEMMVLFMRFLREEMQIAESTISLVIHCHYQDLVEIQRIENYWLTLLQLPSDCLGKTQIKKGSLIRKNILANGVCTISVNNTHLTQHIYGAIQEYGGFDRPEWLF
jgi:transposase